MKHRAACRIAIFSYAAACLMLGGCALMGEDASSAVVSPGKFQYYNCEQLSRVGRSISARERELTELMERAGKDPMGEFVGSVAYKTELLQARGQIKQIDNYSAEKNCAADSKWSSDRALW